MSIWQWSCCDHSNVSVSGQIALCEGFLKPVGKAVTRKMKGFLCEICKWPLQITDSESEVSTDRSRGARGKAAFYDLKNSCISLADSFRCYFQGLVLDGSCRFINSTPSSRSLCHWLFPHPRGAQLGAVS